jgi:glycosyltransferase involved in cell wall biosynthesis
MPQRILFAMNSPNVTGGAMTGILQLVAALPEDKIKPYLVVPRVPNTQQTEILKKYFHGIEVIPMGGGWIKPSSRLSIPLQGRSLLGDFWRSGFYLRTIREFQKLVHRWNIDKIYTGSLMIAGASLAAKALNIPHVWHIKETFGKTGNTRLFYPDHVVVNFIDKLSSTIVVMSNYIAEPFEVHNHSAKVKLVWDGIDLAEYQGNLNGLEIRKRLGIPYDKPLVGLIANLNSPWKNHGLFIRSAELIRARYADVHFVHFGNLPDKTAKKADYFHSLNALVDTLGLTEAFTWAGPIHNIPQMMDSLDILVHPCPTEPFGRIAIEAMAARKPVVGPQSGGIAESVVHGETGLLAPPGDEEAFAEHVLTLLSDQDLRQQMGNKGYERVKTRFLIEDHIENLSAVLFQ